MLEQADKWIDLMNEELKSMEYNKVYDLVQLPESCKIIELRWVCKTKHDSNGNIEQYKDGLVTKGYTKKMTHWLKIDLITGPKERLIKNVLAYVAHYDLELQKMGVKTHFIYVDIEWGCLYGPFKRFKK